MSNPTRDGTRAFGQIRSPNIRLLAATIRPSGENPVILSTRAMIRSTGLLESHGSRLASRPPSPRQRTSTAGADRGEPSNGFRSRVLEERRLDHVIISRSNPTTQTQSLRFHAVSPLISFQRIANCSRIADRSVVGSGESS